MSYYKIGKQPFSTVMLHGLVRAADRQKMSKSKGNVVDPLGVIDAYGTDALRFALVFSTAAGTDIPLAEDKIRGMKHFANKLWNIARFVLTNTTTNSPPHEGELEGVVEGKQKITKTSPTPPHKEGVMTGLTPADRDILSKLDQTIKTVTEALENFRLHEAAQAVYDFTWYEFADKYLEASKEQIKDEKLKDNTEKILLQSTICILKLLHPFMPFVTEEIWSHLKQKDLLMVADWPAPRKTA